MSPTTLAGYRRHIDVAVACRRAAADQAYRTAPRQDVCGAARNRRRHAEEERGWQPQRPAAYGPLLHHVHAVFRSALRQAVKWNLLPDAPTAKATPPQPGKSPAVAMTRAEFTAVRGFARKASYPGLDVLVDMLGLTGLRRSEILGLALDDIDFETGEALVQRAVLAVRNDRGNAVVVRDKTKTASSRRQVTIPPVLLDRLRRHRAFLAEQALAFGADYQPRALAFFSGSRRPPDGPGRPDIEVALAACARPGSRGRGCIRLILSSLDGVVRLRQRRRSGDGAEEAGTLAGLDHGRYLFAPDRDDAATTAAQKIERAMTGDD